MEVFHRFVQAAQLPILPNSVEKRPPPEPDLRCVCVAGGSVAFELVELCDSNLAAAFSNFSEAYIRTSDPSVRIVQKKLRREYRTDAPIELLCYKAGRIVTPDNVVIPTLQPLLREWSHVFRRVWLMGSKRAYLLWDSAPV